MNSVSRDMFNLVCKFSTSKTKEIIDLKEAIRVALVEIEGALEETDDDSIADYLKGAKDALEAAIFEGDYLD